MFHVSDTKSSFFIQESDMFNLVCGIFYPALFFIATRFKCYNYLSHHLDLENPNGSVLAKV